MWPKPTMTRHVWVSQEGGQVPPVQGYGARLAPHSYRWWALVVTAHIDQDGRPTALHQWLPLERLSPVRSEPNGGRLR